MNISKKEARKKELISIFLDCFIEKGLTVTSTKDLCKAGGLQNGGIYYYFSTKEEIILAYAAGRNYRYGTKLSPPAAGQPVCQKIDIRY